MHMLRNGARGTAGWLPRVRALIAVQHPRTQIHVCLAAPPRPLRTQQFPVPGGALHPLPANIHTRTHARAHADFIDPLHHEAACGARSVNLDGWLLDRQQTLDSFCRHTVGADMALIEGVMGLYDGRDGLTDDGSTAQVAKWLHAPVVLVLDCWALARSAAAVVKGFREFDAEVRVAGVVLNRVAGDTHTAWMKQAIGPANEHLAVLGGLPKVGRYCVRVCAVPAASLHGDVLCVVCRV